MVYCELESHEKLDVNRLNQLDWEVIFKNFSRTKEPLEILTELHEKNNDPILFHWSRVTLDSINNLFKKRDLQYKIKIFKIGGPRTVKTQYAYIVRLGHDT